MKKLSFEKRKSLLQHNANLMEKKVGTMKKTEIVEMYQEDFEHFASEIFKTRQGGELDQYGRRIPPRHITFDQALKLEYGVSMKVWLSQMGVYFGEDTLESVGKRFGLDHITLQNLGSMLQNHSEATSFSGLMSTGDINSEYRFIIPEIIISMINSSVEEMGYYSNWVGTSMNISKREIKVPIEKQGNVVAKIIGEGESIPFGTVEFGQKTALVEKVGIGMKFTDELLYESSLDLLAISLRKIGRKMNGTRNMYARNILINGDKKSDGTYNSDESCAVLGVDNTTNGFAWKDIKRVNSQFELLGHKVDRIIHGREDGIDISGIDKFEGFAGQTTLASLRSIIGVPEVMDADTFPMPANQIMFLASKYAMAQLNYRGIRVEYRRNPQNQTMEYFVSDYVGFVITERSARILLDKSVAFSATYGATGGFPTWMNIEQILTEEFE